MCTREVGPEDACSARLPAAAAALPAASTGLAALAGLVVAKSLLGVRARVQLRVGVSGACKIRRPAASYQARLQPHHTCFPCSSCRPA